MYCYDEIERGLFTDQRWCDLVPAFFSGTYVLRDPGYNVASWNLSQRAVTIDDDGRILAAGQPLRFFHFTKITHAGQIMLERYSSGRIEVFELMKWYVGQLANHTPQGLPKGWWAYGNFSNGDPIKREHRRHYRDRPDLQDRYPDPFEAGAAQLAGV